MKVNVDVDTGAIHTSAWVGPPGEKPRIRIDFGRTPFSTKVYFDDEAMRMMVWVAFAASAVLKSLNVLYMDMIRTSTTEPLADFVEYAKRSGIDVRVWNIGDRREDEIEAARAGARSVHELYAWLRDAELGGARGKAKSVKTDDEVRG